MHTAFSTFTQSVDTVHALPIPISAKHEINQNRQPQTSGVSEIVEAYTHVECLAGCG